MGVGDGLPPPPPQEAVVRKSNAAPSKAADEAAVFTFPRRNSNPSNRIAASAASSQSPEGGVPGSFHGRRTIGGAPASMEFTSTVSVSVVLPLAGRVREAGLNVQVVPAGAFGHCRVTAPGRAPVRGEG